MSSQRLRAQWCWKVTLPLVPADTIGRVRGRYEVHNWKVNMLTGSFCSVDGYKDRIHRSVSRFKFIVLLDNIQFRVDFDPCLLAHAIVCREYGRSDKSGGGKCHGLPRTWPHWFDYSLSNQPGRKIHQSYLLYQWGYRTWIPGTYPYFAARNPEAIEIFPAFPWSTQGWSSSGGYAAECPAECLIQYPEMIPLEVSPAEERFVLNGWSLLWAF